MILSANDTREVGLSTGVLTYNKEQVGRSISFSALKVQTKGYYDRANKVPWY